MPFNHIHTQISGTSIQMRFADDPDPAKAVFALDFTLPVGTHLAAPSSSGPSVPIGFLHTWTLATIQLAAVNYVRDALAEEADRLASLAREKAR